MKKIVTLILIALLVIVFVACTAKRKDDYYLAEIKLPDGKTINGEVFVFEKSSDAEHMTIVLQDGSRYPYDENVMLTKVLAND